MQTISSVCELLTMPRVFQLWRSNKICLLLLSRRFISVQNSVQQSLPGVNGDRITMIVDVFCSETLNYWSTPYLPVLWPATANERLCRQVTGEPALSSSSSPLNQSDASLHMTDTSWSQWDLKSFNMKFKWYFKLGSLELYMKFSLCTGCFSNSTRLTWTNTVLKRK